MKTPFQEWTDILKSPELELQSVAIGVFMENGSLIKGNKAMLFFLGTDENLSDQKNFIVNPDFASLDLTSQNEKLFEGLMTIGNRNDTSYVLESKIFRRNNKLLVIAEVNVLQLFIDNDKMSGLNQEINNLQRQLIKEKKNLQATLNELRDTQQMLIHSEKMNSLGKLVAGIAHEINNPISFIYGNYFSLENYTSSFINSYKKIEEAVNASHNTDLINEVREIRKDNDLDYLTEDLIDILKESKNGIERVGKIVGDLRNFSRLDESLVKEIEFIKNIKSTISIANPEMIQKNVKLTFSSPETLYIECYPGQLNQAILNVLINAVQAVGENGIIQISVVEENEFMIISIEDNGCGMSDEIKNKIFDPFFTTKPVGSGTGLGLSITYKIISDLHKGSISFVSSVGKGTTFVLKIPKKVLL